MFVEHSREGGVLFVALCNLILSLLFHVHSTHGSDTDSYAKHEDTMVRLCYPFECMIPQHH